MKKGRANVGKTRTIKAFGGRGILTEQDLKEFGSSERRVYDLMSDGKWRTASQIRAAAGKDGIPAAEGLRRMRALRPVLERRGCKIERSRHSDGRSFLYRIATDETTLF